VILHRRHRISLGWRRRAVHSFPVQTCEDDQFHRLAGDQRYDLSVSQRELDGVDRRILELLVEDARRSASEVGRLVDLSPAAAKRRIDRLEEVGYIRGYTAVLDHAMLGSHLEAFTELRFAPGTQVDDIDQAVADLPELVESFTLAGDPDALLRVRVADVDHLKRVIDQVRRGRRGGAKIIGTKTLIVLGTTTGRGGVMSAVRERLRRQPERTS
jgi:Lrp/AsnC family leucine-responsive transcriptional regulator